MGAGKDTIAKHLVKEHGFVRYAYADPLKELCANVVDRNEIGWTGADWTGPKTDVGRSILQRIGHGARQSLIPDVWVQTLAGRIDANAPQNVVISDVRYPNEARWVQEHGLLVRVTRPGVDRSGPEHQHPTETSIDSFAVDWDFENIGTIDELCEDVDSWLGYLRVGSWQTSQRTSGV
jgi:hypothetical protein